MKKEDTDMMFVHDYARTTSALRVVYIVYHDGEVHAVTCANEYGGQTHFDFYPDCIDVERFMHYHSGSGGRITEIQAPQYVKAGGTSYWLHPDAKFRGTAKNIKRLKDPIAYEGDANPFNHAREVYGIEYCKICEKHYDDEACPDHHTWDDEKQSLVYADGSIVE